MRKLNRLLKTLSVSKNTETCMALSRDLHDLVEIYKLGTTDSEELLHDLDKIIKQLNKGAPYDNQTD